MKHDDLYMEFAHSVAKRSRAVRLNVGAVAVKGDRIISYGWNGTPSGFDNSCEIVLPDGSLQTKPEVVHAEKNMIAKLACSHESSRGATVFITHSPCFECATLLLSSKIERVVFSEFYRSSEGIDILRRGNVLVEKYSEILK